MNWKWIGVGLFSISSIVYYATSTKENTNLSVQQSTVHSIENKKKHVIETVEKIDKPIHAPNNSKQNVEAVNTFSGTDVSKPKDAATTINNVLSTENKEMVAPTVNILTNTKNTSKIETEPKELFKAIDCSLTKITFSITTETSCENTETGGLHIGKITGGVAPYSFTLNNKKIKENNIFELGAGTYEVKISDKNGCSTEQSATILEKKCASNLVLGEKFNINPTIGETCSIPFNTDKKGNLTIYNRSGKIIYKTTNSSSDYVEWNGTDVYGALAEAGLYVYIIEYADGIKVTGEVNIIR